MKRSLFSWVDNKRNWSECTVTQLADNGHGNRDRLDPIESILVRIAERQDRITEQQEANLFQLGQFTATATNHDRRRAQIE